MTGAQAAGIDRGAAVGRSHRGSLPSWVPEGFRDTTADAFVSAHMPLVIRMARRMARRLPPHVALDDLVSAGMLGLIDAARRYDPEVCDRFEAFAEYRVRGAMLDELRSHDSLSRDLRARSRRRDEAVFALQQTLGRAPTSEEVATELGVELEDYQRLLGRMHRGQVASAEAMTRDGLGAQAFADPRVPNPCDVAIAKERRDLLARAIGELPERLKLVTSLYYKEGLTLSQIGASLGVTEARACQLRGEAVRRIKDIVDSWEIEPG